MNSEDSQPAAEANGRVYRPISLRTYGLTMIFASLASLAILLSRTPALRVDGQHMLSDVPAVTTLRGQFLPLRAIAAGIGAVTSYDARTGALEIWRGRDTVALHIGEKRGRLNGMPFTLRHPPFIVRGRVMVPAALFERALSSSVHVDSARETIEITSRPTPVPKRE